MDENIKKQKNTKTKFVLEFLNATAPYSWPVKICYKSTASTVQLHSQPFLILASNILEYRRASPEPQPFDFWARRLPCPP